MARFNDGREWYAGTVSKVYPRGCVDVQYDDGDFEEKILLRLEYWAASTWEQSGAQYSRRRLWRMKLRSPFQRLLIPENCSPHCCLQGKSAFLASAVQVSCERVLSSKNEDGTWEYSVVAPGIAPSLSGWGRCVAFSYPAFDFCVVSGTADVQAMIRAMASGAIRGGQAPSSLLTSLASRRQKRRAGLAAPSSIPAP
eukprot:6204908-Pleurochrysis_carterae.AAC.1